MQNKCSPFGEYLKELIKEAGMNQTEFYTALGIKKPYFYDIVSGRINPPPPKLQFKTIQILQPSEEKKRVFFDLAAKARGDIPADVVEWIESTPEAISNIRESMK